jgi:DNA-binding CsgD family transcriptional regulator
VNSGPLPGEVLVKLYGLALAETRIIGLLASDLGLDAAAAALGIARTTARTHLKHIFEKTGTSRQSQLMNLVLSALPRPPGRA